MNALTRSRNTMMLLAGAAGFYALGTVFAIVAYATFSGDTLTSYNTFRDLGHAADWLHFVGALLALAAVCAAGWERMPARVIDEQAELATAAVATLLIAIASLVSAASDSSASTANILLAVGIGIWGMLVLTRAARLNLADQEIPGTASPLATVWLIAAGGLLLFAIGSGFTVGPTDQGAGIAVGVLEALGFILLAWAIVSARGRGLLGGLPAGMVVQALAVLAVAGVISAVVSGLVFTPHGTLKGLRIGVSITYTVRLVGVMLLGWAAWRRLGELVSGRPATAGSRGGWSFSNRAGLAGQAATGEAAAGQAPADHAPAGQAPVGQGPVGAMPSSAAAAEQAPAPPSPGPTGAAPPAAPVPPPGGEAGPTEGGVAGPAGDPTRPLEAPEPTESFEPQSGEAPPPPPPGASPT